MKTRWIVTVLLITSLAVTAGCRKKETPAPSPSAPAKSETPKPAEVAEVTEALDDVKETAAEKVEEVKEAVKEAVEEVKESFTMDVNLEKTISELKAEAAKMDVKTLTEVAMKYKEAILAKQGKLESLVEKLKAIPMAEKLGAEAQELTTEIKTLTDSLAPLKERFGVYVDAIKAKGGDLKNLTI